MIDWRELVTTTQWRQACEAKVRRPRTFAEVLDVSGVTIADRVPITGGTVSYAGESPEQWACSIELTDPTWVPQDWRTDVLHPLAGHQLRLWWGLEIPYFGGWVGLPVGTYDVEDPSVSDNGRLTLQVTGRDPLAQFKRSGYGGQTVALGGLNVGAALVELFAAVAPRRRVTTGATGVALPALYDVGGNKPGDDAETIAATAGWIGRTDREGVINWDTTPEPNAYAAEWIEGPDCPVTEIGADLRTSEIKNAWMAKSTSAEIVPPIVSRAMDVDDTSATWVGRVGPYWGDTIESDAISSQEAADNIAYAALEKNRRPMQTVKVKIPPRPDLNYMDLVALSRERAGIVGGYRVASWRLDLAGGLMDVTMMARAIQ